MLSSRTPPTASEQHDRMTKTPIPKLVTSLAVPTVFAQLVTMIYNTADTYFVSQINESASGAVGVSFSLMAVIQAVAGGIGMGGGNLISIYLGAKKDEDAKKTASSAFFSSLLAGFLILAIGLIFLSPMMRLFGATKTILPYAVSYSRYILFSAPFFCASFILNNILRSEGQATLSTIGLCAGGLLNIPLDPLFIHRFEMGIAGAALATMISQMVSFFILLIFFFRGRSVIRLHPRYISKKASDYFLILKVGFPTICRQGMASLSTSLLNGAAGVYGDAAVAAVTIANKIYMLVRNLIIGIGQGFQPVAGYNFGAGIRKRVKSSFAFSCLCGTVLTTVIGALIFWRAEAVMAWFIDVPEVIEIGSLALRFACSVMPLLAFSTLVNQLYQCLGFTVIAAILASCRQGICFIPLILLLPAHLGLTGIQAAQPGADLLTFLLSVPFAVLFFRKFLKRAKNNPAL
ncbi:MAG: MATE family efflux transporter [Clostridia bacterium]|nr:MATE family efflux transporter [Clostridia bacterium]